LGALANVVTDTIEKKFGFCKYLEFLSCFAITSTSTEEIIFASNVLRSDQKVQGGKSQNFLSKFEICFLTLGLKVFRLFRLKVLFESDIIKG